MSSDKETFTDTLVTCKNCNHRFEGNFCPNCSQKANTHRLTLPHLAHEVFHAFTHTDKGILFLIKKMFRWPGIVAKEYVAGKRKKYFSPVTFLLITMAFQIYLTKKTDFYNGFIDQTKKLIENISSSQNQQPAQDSIKQLDEVKGQTSKSMEHSRTLTFLFLPVLALLTWIFFKKSGYNYSENLVLAIFVQGQLNILFLLFCIVPFLLYPPVIVLIFYLYMVLLWAYSLMAYRQFFGQRKWVTILKGSIVQIAYFALGQQIATIVLQYL